MVVTSRIVSCTATITCSRTVSLVSCKPDSELARLSTCGAQEAVSCKLLVALRLLPQLVQHRALSPMRAHVNRWSSERHQVHLFGRVATEVGSAKDFEADKTRADAVQHQPSSVFWISQFVTSNFYLAPSITFRPASDSRYFCVGLLGESGCVIST